MTKVKEMVSSFHSSAKLLVLQLSALSAIERLRESKRAFYSLHISNGRISEDSLNDMVIRDSREQTKKVMELLHKVRIEKSRLRMFSKKKILCFSDIQFRP